VHIRRSTRCLIVGIMATIVVLAHSLVAFAQSYPGGNNTPPPTVGGEQFHRGAHLGSTGTDVLLWVVIALVAILAGIALRKVTRTRAAHSGD
jgi:hypothetical protein